MSGRSAPIYRAIVTAFLAIFLVGFGLCGAVGVLYSHAGGLVVLACGLAGLGVAWAAGWAIREMWRKPPSMDE